MTEFEKVFTRINELMPSIQMNPGKSIQAVNLIKDWLTAGCDAELDIIPTINKLWAKNPTVNSVAYFDKQVRRSREERVGSIEHQRRLLDNRANAIRFQQRMGRYIPTYDEKWLEQYESSCNADSVVA